MIVYLHYQEMGIKYLNKFLLNRCVSQDSIRNNVSFAEFRDKVLVIDASIYIYKFLEERALIENMYLFVSILRHHMIVPVFVFDGKSPPEKRELLYARRQKKREAEKTYMELKASLGEDMNEDAENRLETLRRQFIRMTNDNIQATKDLLTACGVLYYEASGEADELCAHMVITNKAWACVSDDMDMFVYGCPRVIRSISIPNQSCVYYTLDSILRDLGMTLVEFRQIMVLSGTDYNLNDTTNLNETMNWYYEYKKQMARGTKVVDFYDWLCKNTKYITNIELLEKVYNMFMLDNTSSTFPEIPNNLCLGQVNEDALTLILEKEGFLR